MTGLIDFLGRLQRKDITLLLLTALSVQPLILPEAWQPTWFSSDLQSLTVFRPPGCFGQMSEVVAHHTAFQSSRTELNVALGLFIYSYMHYIHIVSTLCTHLTAITCEPLYNYNRVKLNRELKSSALQM